MASNLEEWVSNSLPKVLVRSPQSVHLNELDGVPEWVTLSKQALLGLFLQLVEMTATRDDISPVMVIPLGVTDTLDLAAPDLEQLPIGRGESEHEPPSLYLISRQSCQLFTSYEEYRCPLETFSLSKTDRETGKIQVYYRCFRDEHARRLGWEFSRCIYFEYWPEVLQWQ